MILPRIGKNHPGRNALAVDRTAVEGQSRQKGEMEKPMGEQRPESEEERGVIRGDGLAREGRAAVSQLWLILPLFLFTLAAGAGLARVIPALRWQSITILAAAVGTLGFAYIVNRLVVSAAGEEPVQEAIGKGLRELLDSAGPAVVAMNLDGQMFYSNPPAERLLGYRPSELLQLWGKTEILAPGESERLVAEIQKLCHVSRPPEPTSAGRMAAYLACVRMLPPSMVPSFSAQVRHKDGAIIPVTLHISALRGPAAELTGMVAVAVEQGSIPQREQAQRESQERYRDLFEHSSEMIATLSPTGQFLFANPAWRQCFGLDRTAMLALHSFEELFSKGTRAEVAELFGRALSGELVERAPLRHYTPEGRVLELELSLSRRQKSGHSLAVRCLLRDVTQQKHRESRLALQLAISQIVGENASGESAGMRILEALCVSQGWELGIAWLVNTEPMHLEFGTAWGAPGQQAEDLIQQSMDLTLANGSELPERAWKEGRPVWIADLAAASSGSRVAQALQHDMVSGWAVPVRAANKVLAVLEFYTRFRLLEDREALAAVEIAAASLGQLLARTQESGRVDDLRRQQEILMDAVTDGICGLDREGHVRFANPAAWRLLGAPSDALAGKPLHELLHASAPLDRACGEDCPLRKAAARPVSAAGEENFFRADGSSFPAEYVLTPIHGHGSFSGWVLSFRDISQRYALDRMKDEFISTVSHELRTPLTSIRGALGLLTSGMLGELNDKASSLLRIALTNSDRLVRLINDILDLERIQSGREPLAFRPLQLADIVRQAIEDIQPVADAAGVKLLHDATKAEITGDPDRLLQVITNLLSNAVKFSPANSPVSVMLRPGVTGVILSVIDHGRGIPADKLEAIFGRFQQVDASDARLKGGTGLGLAICRTIVLQHSGRIWAERNPVRGSTFRIFLPHQPVPVAAQDGTPDAEAGFGTVILADANPESRLKIAAQLSRHGYSVVQTSTVEQTLSAARQGAHAILVDTSLDGMNGWAILPLLRRLDTAARTPVVLLSVEDQNGVEMLPGVAQGRVPKPLEEDTLLTELARVLCGSGDTARILIVEDDRDLARVISEVFAREGITVQTAHSLEETIDACAGFAPHLLVLDIGLPDGDGFNVVDWLRQSESLASLPLVVYSGRDLSPAERRHLTLGPTYFMAKTRVQPQQLEALVLTMLRSLRQTHEPAAASLSVPNS
jgi:PAS domain S-box-containing protein